MAAAAAVQRPRRMPPIELVREMILPRLPPREPACLVRASLVCKTWRRIFSDPSFRSRYRELHGPPPLLGYIHVLKGDEPYFSRFVSTSALRPAGRDFPGWLVLDCRHGRALFATSSPDAEGAMDLVVWNPITNDERRLPKPPYTLLPAFAKHDCNAAVLCAAEGCDHIDCHGGPFRVVFVATSTSYMETATSARVYLSESGAWSETTSVHHHLELEERYICVDMMPSVLVGDALFFSCGRKHILEYQLSAQQLSVIATPARFHGSCIVIMTGGDALLKLVDIDRSSIYLWSREVDAHGIPRWVQSRTIELQTLLPDDVLPVKSRRIYVSGFVEGTDVIFVHSSGYVYMVQLKSRQVTKMAINWGRLYPFTGFGIPGIKAASICEGPRDGASSA